MEEGPGDDAGAGGDRLSGLPDCLLHEIMSRLKARQVVQTCVLSTRWRRLWRSVPCLDVDQEEFETTLAGGDNGWENFEDFADNLLCHLNIATLDSFRLRVVRASHGHWTYSDSQAAGVFRWIRRAIKYCAQPPGVHREGPLGSRYWRLRRLHLCNVRLHGRFEQHVSTGCPFLEDLVLENCQDMLVGITSDVHVLRNSMLRGFTSGTLKNLVLKDCSFSCLSEVSAPKLKSLHIEGDHHCARLAVKAPDAVHLFLAVRVDRFRASFFSNEMPSLAKASVHVRDDGDRKHQLTGSDLHNVLHTVSNVTSLELSGFGTMVVVKGSKKFPEFKNLRTLLLNDCDLSDNFKTLVYFLQNSPNLEKLTMHLCKLSSGRGIMSKSNMTSSSQCWSLRLTEIVYKDEDSGKLVNLLLGTLGKLPENHVKLTKLD